MNFRGMPFLAQLAVPSALLFLGFGIWMWLSPIPDGELTTAQSDMLATADWLIKVSAGVLLGIGSNAGIRARSGNGATK